METIAVIDKLKGFIDCIKCGNKIEVFKKTGEQKCPCCGIEFSITPIQEAVINHHEVKWVSNPNELAHPTPLTI